MPFVRPGWRPEDLLSVDTYLIAFAVFVTAQAPDIKAPCTYSASTSADPASRAADRCAETEYRQPLLSILDDVLHDVHGDIVACERGELFMSPAMI